MNKKMFILGLVISMLTYLLLEFLVKDASSLLEVNKNKKDKLLITAIGDSLTKGIGDIENSGYIDYLIDSLDDKYKVTIVNHGKSGDTTSMITTRINNSSKIQDDLTNANIITLTVGGNDLMKVVKDNVFSLTIDKVEKYKNTYISNLEKTYNTIRKYNKKAPIYILGIYNPFYLNFKELVTLQEIVDEFNLATSTYSKDKMYFIPINDQLYKGLGIDDNSTVNELLSKEDSFHPNSIGYKIIANEFYNKIINTKKTWEVTK